VWRTLLRIVDAELRASEGLEVFRFRIARKHVRACRGINFLEMQMQGLLVTLQLHKMDYLPEFPGDLNLEDGLPQVLTLGILALTAIYAFTRLFTDPEAGVVYNVSEPEQLAEGWKGEVLEEPTLTVYNLPVETVS
jgi:hypothetical protein